MKRFRIWRLVLCGLVVASIVSGVAPPLAGAAASGMVKLRFVWFTNGPDLPAVQSVIKEFNAKNPDIQVDLAIVSYAELNQLLITQAEAGQAPDLARVSEHFRYYKYMLDLRPYLHDKEFAKAFIPEAMAVTSGPAGEVYGIPHDFTVDGPFINVTAVKKAGLEVPTAARVSWNEWIDLAKKAAKATGIPYAFAADRSGNRLDGFVESGGGSYFSADGKSLRITSPETLKGGSEFVRLHKEGAMPLEIWAGSTGYAGANQLFANGQVVLYLSGNWQVGFLDKTIGAKFEWKAIPDPCEQRCSGMPGGKFLVAFKNTKYPEQVARLIEFLGSRDAMGSYVSQASFLPTRLDLIKAGVTYSVRSEDMNVFVRDIPNLAPTAYQDNYNRWGGQVADVVRDRLTQAIIGELTVQQALERAEEKAKELIQQP
jgi:alpha-1,4-digalacturonate transport system substrate-binding protein